MGGSRGRRGHPPALWSLRNVGKLPRQRKRLPSRPPAAAAALHARQRQLRVVQSYFARGGTGGGAWGDVAPRAPGRFGGMRAPARAAATASSCRGDARQPGRAPRAAFVRHLGSVAARLLGCEPERGTRRSSLPDPLDATLTGRSVGGQWEDHGGGAREEVSWGSVPKVAVPPEPLVVGRKGSVDATFKTPSCIIPYFTVPYCYGKE